MGKAKEEDQFIIDNAVSRYTSVICEALDKRDTRDVRTLIAEMERETVGRDGASPLRRQAAEAMRRARRLPVGPDRNDLRQLAIGLLWLDRKGLAEKVRGRLRVELDSGG